jgi:metal-sulfur cluster biosynthetic enzyme
VRELEQLKAARQARERPGSLMKYCWHLTMEFRAMAIEEDKVREALKQVIDPELFVNVVDLGLIYDVKISETSEGKSNIDVQMTMTSPACPAGPQLLGQSKAVIGNLENVGDVDVRLVMDPPWTPDRMTEEARDQLGIF